MDPEHLVSVSCCTEGLFQAVAGLRLGPGDEVILPTIHFVGAANAIAAAGATPVFCDVHPRHLNPTADDIRAALTPRTRAVLILHYGGWPLELEEIAALCRRRRLWLIEDAANSVASAVGGKACGTFGDVGVWSFDAMKVLVTGDGGMVWCRDPEVLSRVRSNTTLGLSELSGIESLRPDRWWEFEVASFGRRAILNDLAAAIGLVQLDRLGAFIRRRQAVHDFYLRRLAGLDWLTLPPEPPPAAAGTYAFFWVQCAAPLRDRLAGHLRQNDVYTTFRYHPLHLVPIYGPSRRLPRAEEAAETTLLLPQHQALSREDLEKIAGLVRNLESA